jgi:hypothetical protein
MFIYLREDDDGDDGDGDDGDYENSNPTESLIDKKAKMESVKNRMFKINDDLKKSLTSLKQFSSATLHEKQAKAAINEISNNFLNIFERYLLLTKVSFLLLNTVANTSGNNEVRSFFDDNDLGKSLKANFYLIDDFVKTFYGVLNTKYPKNLQSDFINERKLSAQLIQLMKFVNKVNDKVKSVSDLKTTKEFLSKAKQMETVVSTKGMS